MRVLQRGEAALTFAAIAHGAQRYGDRPYSSHLASVMATTAELGFTTAEHMAVAALHDVLEDTKISARELEQRFGPTIANAVKQVTRRKGMLLEQYFGAMGPLAFAVKIADRISNLRQHGREPGNRERQRTHLYPKYEREQAHFRRHRLSKDPRFVKAIALLEVELEGARVRLDLPALLGQSSTPSFNSRGLII